MKNHLVKLSFLFLIAAISITAIQALATGLDEIIHGSLTQADQQELQQLQSQIYSLQQQAQGINQEIGYLNDQVENQSREVDRLRSIGDAASRDLREVENDIRQSRDKISRLQGQLQEARNRRNQEIARLQNQINQIRSQQIPAQEGAVRSLEQQLQAIYNTRNPAAIPPLQKEISDLQNRRSSQQRAYDQAMEGLKKWDAVSEEDCKQSIVCFSQRAQLRSARDNAKSEMNKIDSQISVKQNEINRLNSIERAYAAKEQEVNRAKQSLAQLGQQINVAESTLRNLQSQPLREEEMIRQEESDLRRAENRRPDLQRRLSEIRNQLYQREQNLRNLVQRRDSVASQAQYVNNQINDLQRRIDDIESKKSDQIVLVGSKLSSSMQSELNYLNANLLIAENSAAATAVRDSRSMDVVMLVDSMVVARMGRGVLTVLGQIVNSGGLVTLVGQTQVLSTLIEAQDLLPLCGAPVMTSVGPKTVCSLR